MVNLDKDKLRNLPGWERNAPVPICMDGDYRALTFCCKPGFSLTFGYKCKRDDILNEIGLSPDEFIEIKERFSKKNNWDSDVVCFGSISYCCMRAGGCPRRDFALVDRYPDMLKEEIMKLYFQKKKELSKKILEAVQDSKGKEKVKEYLELF
jgi:predicted metal-binding transcription factor (methanogenesis marker protein 9)